MSGKTLEQLAIEAEDAAIAATNAVRTLHAAAIEAGVDQDTREIRGVLLHIRGHAGALLKATRAVREHLY